MSDPTAPDNFRLPRLSRVKTRPREARARWSELLAQLAFVAMIVLTIGQPWMTDQGDPSLAQIREIGYAAVLVAALVAIRPWRHPERLAVVPWPLLVALGWCWLSLTWALEPAVGLRRLVLTSIVLWSLFALVRELGQERAVTLLRVLMAALLVANFVAALAYPQIGVHPASEYDLAGHWRGIMSQKNWAGLTCSLTILLFAFGAAQVPVAARAAVIAGAALFLAMTDSATSIYMGAAALLVGALFAWGARTLGPRRLAPSGWAWLPLAVLAAICVHMAIDPGTYLAMVADPSGFTGRNQIWQALIRAYADRPWLGLGYGSLWDLGPEGPMTHYATGWAADVSQGHNGYLDLLAQIGGPGTLLVLFAVIVWPLQRLLRGGDHPARILGAAMLLFCLGHNFTETTLFDRDALGQVFLMLAIALLWGATASSAHAPVREPRLTRF